MDAAEDPAKEAQKRAVEFATGQAAFDLNGAFAASALNFKIGYLFRAVEMASRAVLTAWGIPSAGPKVWTGLFNRLSHYLSSDVVTWARRVEARNPLLVEELLVTARAHVQSIIDLASADAPNDWTVRQGPLEWSQLPPEDRAFLVDAVGRAAVLVPGAELWLFGSRATDQARPDSDFDVRLVIPDGTPDNIRGMAMGELWLAAQDHGIQLDHDAIRQADFETPGEGDVLLIYEIHAYGIPVPRRELT